MDGDLATARTPGAGTSPPRASDPGRPLACLLGDMDLLRALALDGIDAAVVATADFPVAYSRSARTRIPWSDPWTDPGSLVESLLSFAATQSRPPVLFFQNDGDLLLVSRHRDRLAERFRFAIAPADLVESVVDKARFHELAAAAGLPVPATRHLPADGDPPELDLTFPIVVKPLTRRLDRWAHVRQRAKAMRVDSADELAAAWPTLTEAGLELVAQELVPGSEDRVESYHVYVDADGEVAGEFTGRKLRTEPVEFGHSSAVVITDEPDVAEEGRRVVEGLGLRGVAKVDFKRDPSGRLWLLEVNPRFNLWHYPGAVAGVNLPALVYADLTGRPRPPVSLRPGVRWCDPVRDLRAAGRSPLRLARRLAWDASCEARWALAPDDPMPFLRGMVVRHGRKLLRRGSSGTA